jgi:hypothetical protein
MGVLFWLSFIAICWFLVTRQENYTSLNDCNCLKCGICRNRRGNTVCVPGNEYGPYFAEDCMNYTHSSLYVPYYYDNNYYNNYNNRIYSRRRRRNSYTPRRTHTPRQTPPHTPRQTSLQTPPRTQPHTPPRQTLQQTPRQTPRQTPT